VSRFLVVDDNLAFAENLAEILGDAGDEALVADSGRRAIELVQTLRFDGLVSDMRMPEMNGTEVLRHLRRIDAGLPAIIITAFTSDHEIDRVRHEGVLGVLPKPLPVARLLELLRVARRHAVVAIVEDDRALADNLREVLQQHGFASVLVGSVPEAETLDELPLFAAIVDLRLPGGPDGEAMRRLATRFPSLPMLVVSAHAEVLALVPSARRFIKPFATSALIDELVQLHHQHAPR